MLRRLLIFAVVLMVLTCGCNVLKNASWNSAGHRRVISLDGTWGVGQSSMDSMPESFSSKVPVPGLVDMAEPAFEDVGKKSDKRQAFWYRRTFKVSGAIPETAVLKIHKAKYGTKVWLNGKVVGEHLPCFTPCYLDVKDALRCSGQENELVVRVGADRESVPAGQPSGWDFEKYLYIPGIYDSVDLILTGEPYIVNVQTAPDIAAGKVKVVTEIQCGVEAGSGTVNFEVREARSGKIVGDAVLHGRLSASKITKIEAEIPIEGCKLWSPENPFLYELRINTGGDNVNVRFAIRSFKFDKNSGRAILNGKPYFMRGTNVCAYRFFEDTERGDKPWRKNWVRKLHRKFKSMNWNSIRYCIGFPPDFWYDIADEEGFLIQDEFPIWLLGNAPEKPLAEKIVPEYTEWMRERWNHASVVMWDAQNESNTTETGKALGQVRHLDLSNRPWENGWAAPQSDGDFVESHPYLFSKLWDQYWGDDPGFKLADMVKVSGTPSLQSEQKKRNVPIIINEYAWLWLNRDGTTTCLTGSIYEKLLGPDSATEERQLLYAKYLAALTEFWRCRRECAGVLHFCGLGYSRAGDKPRPEGGATSDHFIDLEKLKFEPFFEKYVRQAFSPVGVMVDFWGEELGAGSTQEIKVVVINDLYEDWRGNVLLQLKRNGKKVAEQVESCTVKSLGSKTLTFSQQIPEQVGDYKIVAVLETVSGNRISSVRDFKVKAPIKK